MDNLKKYAKYILMIIGGYILTSFLIFIALNAGYTNISSKGNIPEQISIDKAEATKTQGRIYGYIQNSEQNDVNGKYIKTSLYNSSNENIATEYLEINNVKYDSSKLFKVTFNVDNVTSYEISIVD